MKLELVHNNEANSIVARLIEEEGATPVSLYVIKSQLTTLGYPQLRLDDKAVAQLLSADKKGEITEVEIALIRDAKAEVKLADDARRAYLTITPANGGKDMTIEVLTEVVLAAGVDKSVIKSDELEACIDQRQVKDRCIAESLAPKAGEAARYERLVDPDDALELEVDSQGKTDVRGTHHFTIVEPGTPLMRRHPPTVGAVGKTVCGEELEGLEGKDKGFRDGLTGVVFSEDDPDLIVADIKGHPVYFDNGVNVDPTLRLQNVDLKSGHVEFEGSLEVLGDIAPCMKVEVSGNVVVKGTIEQAEVVAGNDIIVNGGVLHCGKVAVESDEGDEQVIGLKAGGKVKAKFIHHSAVQAEGNIEAKEYISNSWVVSQASVLIGQEGGRGTLMAGRSEAKTAIKAKVIGAESCVHTKVVAGADDEAFARSQTLSAELHRRQTELAQLLSILTKLKNGDDPQKLGQLKLDKVRKVSQAIFTIKTRIEQLLAERSVLDGKLQSKDDIQVVVQKMLYPNVLLSINGAQWRVKEEHRASVWVRRGQRIIDKNKQK